MGGIASKPEISQENAIKIGKAVATGLAPYFKEYEKQFPEVKKANEGEKVDKVDQETRKAVAKSDSSLKLKKVKKDIAKPVADELADDIVAEIEAKAGGGGGSSKVPGAKKMKEQAAKSAIKKAVGEAIEKEIKSKAEELFNA